MSAPLVPIDFPSCYFKGSIRLSLPKRMAQCTPDMKAAISATSAALAAKGGNLYLSDLFRSYAMQSAAHNDWKTGKKSAYSGPAGESLHEAGRAFDLDLNALKISLGEFWKLAAPAGLVPIISKPTSGVSESWHFECRGSHQLVYDYYRAGKGNNFVKNGPYKAMAASAIVSVGIQVDKFGAASTEAAYVQSGLIRLGANIGNMDGSIGPKSKAGMAALGIDGSSLASAVAGVEAALKAKFPKEY